MYKVNYIKEDRYRVFGILRVIAVVNSVRLFQRSIKNAGLVSPICTWMCISIFDVTLLTENMKTYKSPLMLYSLLTLSTSQVFSLVEHSLFQSPDQHTPFGICYSYPVSKGYNKQQ